MRNLGLAASLLLLLGQAVPAWARFTPPPPCRNPYTEQQEITEGAKAALAVYQTMPVLPDSDPVARYVAQLGARLVRHAPGAAWPYNFHVIASSEVNAFALPGGSVFVNLGTVQASETEAQLAGVMAHEISHVVLRHATCNIGKQQKRNLGYGLGAIASAVLLGDGAAGTLAQQGISSVRGLQYLHMSRDSEMQADLLGTDILYDAGFDPRGLPQFFEIIQQKYGAGGSQLLSDHPNPGNRTEYVNAEIATLPRLSDPIVTSPGYKTMHAEAASEPVFTGKQIEAKTWAGTGRYAAGPEGIASPSATNPALPGMQTAGTQPVGAQTAGTARTQTGNATPSDVPLTDRTFTDRELGLASRLTLYQGQSYTVSVPANWTVTKNANDSTVTLAPANGSGSFGIAYGALVGTVHTTGDGVSTADQLATATAALIRQLASGNGGLEQSTRTAPATLTARQLATTTELTGSSPFTRNGQRVPEHDLLLTVARPDGDLNYVVFVAPEADFSRLRSLFNRMLASFQAQ